MSDLLYLFTGLEKVPPFGLHKKIEISFSEEEKFAKISTCAYTVVLPFKDIEKVLKISLEYGGGFGCVRQLSKTPYCQINHIYMQILFRIIYLNHWLSGNVFTNPSAFSVVCSFSFYHWLINRLLLVQRILMNFILACHKSMKYNFKKNIKI